MYTILKDIIYDKAHLGGVYLAQHNSRLCLTIKEKNEVTCKEITLVGFESSENTFGFKLDVQNIKKISQYFENKKGLDKGNDGIIFTTISGKKYVFICELKDGSRGFIAQFKSTSCFIDYLKSIMKRFYGIESDDLIFKYVVFSKYGKAIVKTSGKYLSHTHEGFDVYNLPCSPQKEYNIESFI